VDDPIERSGPLQRCDSGKRELRKENESTERLECCSEVQHLPSMCKASALRITVIIVTLESGRPEFKS
jgi:hypothetical protein